VWIALVSACAFTGIYTFRVADEARQLATALYATEMVLAREQHLSALDGLAAAAAHELGTPLATISLVTKELEREIGPGAAHADDVALLRSQAERCREILTKLTSLSGEGDHLLTSLSLSHLLAEVAEPYRVFSDIVIGPPRGAGPEPIVRRNPAILQGLANLLENAVDFAKHRVEVAAEWTDGRVQISIADDGPGFAAGILNRLGEPYLTTRPDGEAGGLGLGLFIATSLLERTGARLTFANRRPPQNGALATIVWSRGGIDATGSEVWLDVESVFQRTPWREQTKSL
jgi:two-component system sensor histidine kinase RegB